MGRYGASVIEVWHKNSASIKQVIESAAGNYRLWNGPNLRTALEVGIPLSSEEMEGLRNITHAVVDEPPYGATVLGEQSYSSPHRIPHIYH